MKHFASPSFWTCYKKLPEGIQKLADKNFELLKINPQHPSLHFKKINKYCSVRVGKKYRALAFEIEDGLVWFWIGTHSGYDKLLS
ncbi:MAG: hypothetical protein A2W05_11125 [Candidatus Schekmanbacteria bacterium RBG_16_38_10]|uniref:ParE-like toxin domain-containing protein n=1 Tax=Candidatus Schekmanbacteria bacterium RBG_16_38_10 TaxID=1817879 RepID=A0A1F7RUN3_9BACT|nr:MAG: hypothetical protein A2W05_11125 [Candidatus Schekmanbacteria bacterium RBG_16_38_10]